MAGGVVTVTATEAVALVSDTEVAVTVMLRLVLTVEGALYVAVVVVGLLKGAAPRARYSRPGCAPRDSLRVRVVQHRGGKGHGLTRGRCWLELKERWKPRSRPEHSA